MKASELRIGNFFKFISTGNIKKVMLIDMFDKRECNINNVSISDVEPIPLTEEWRNKLGLGIDDSFLLGIDEKFYYLKLTPENNVLVYSQDYEEFTFIGEKKYVHEIQNLVHALTGEELQVKE